MEPIINLFMSYLNTFAYSFVSNSHQPENVLFDFFIKICEKIHLYDFYLDYKCYMGWNIFCFGLISLILLVIIIRYFLHRKCLSACSIFIFWSGYILYLIGFYHEGTADSALAIHLRSIISSLEMFVAHSDLLEVCPTCKESPLYMTCFVLVHFIAVVISLLVVLNWAKERISKYLHVISVKSSQNLYVFFDVNDAAWTLAKNINEFYKGNNSNKEYRIVFIDEPGEIEDEKTEKRFVDLLGIKAFRKSTQERFKSKEVKNALYVRSEKKISSNFLFKRQNIWSESNLDDVGDLIKKSQNIHLFLFSDNEQDNITATWNLQQDNLLKNKKFTIYCKARDNDSNRAAVNKHLLFNVVLIDDSALSIDVLKKWKVEEGFKEMYPAHPINFVKTNNKVGCVESKFTSLIIGCGRTGRDALRFIYEFGAFVGTDNEKSPFECYIVDKNIKSIQGGMERNIPALQLLDKEIKFCDMDFYSAEFNEELKRIINDLNYVVVAAGDDEQNINIANDIYEYAIRYRKKGIDRFNIFVRVYNKVNENIMDSVAQFYSNADNNNVIKVFGKKDEIYTFKNVIEDNEAKKLACDYFMAYQHAAHSYDFNDWQERHDEISNAKDNYNKMLELEHKEKQDYSNVLHMYTKIKLCDYLSKKTFDSDDYPFDLLNNNRVNDYIKCMYRLSKMEHLRWVAAYYMAGFIFGSEKDFRKKTHKFILPFEDLGEIQKYDYAVVKTTIDLYQKNNNIQIDDDNNIMIQ